MLRALLLGVLSAFFFSSTFVLNRAMSLEGGHWAWTAALRYAYMLLMLLAWLGITRQGAVLRGVRDALRSRPLFWMLTGSVGFGVFYAPLCYSATRMPGWVVAATWQATILATPLVLLLFGRKVPTRGMAFTGLIFLGIVLVNLEQAGGFGDAAGLILGVLPVLLAALAYPLGNQLAWEARSDAARGGPEAANPALESGPGLVLLLCLGSLPFWLALLLVVRPEAPADGQWVQTALVAFLAGVVATSLFLHARNRARSSYELAAVDATQSMEVVFSLVGEVLFLHAAPPGLLGFSGIALVTLGLVLYVARQTAGRKAGG
ncbi:DMT family transporter [Desulfovibrio sp.]